MFCSVIKGLYYLMNSIDSKPHSIKQFTTSEVSIFSVLLGDPYFQGPELMDPELVGWTSSAETASWLWAPVWHHHDCWPVFMLHHGTASDNKCTCALFPVLYNRCCTRICSIKFNYISTICDCHSWLSGSSCQAPWWGVFFHHGFGDFISHHPLIWPSYH